MLFLLGLGLVGCVSRANIQWVADERQFYGVLIVTQEEWVNLGGPPNALCGFLEPSIVLVRDHVPIDSCINHELGHLREYLEGVPYHSKYTAEGVR